MAEPILSPEVVERVRRMVTIEHPEMEGAEVQVAVRRCRSQPEIARAVGLPAVELPAEKLYTVTLRQDVEAEDGVRIPLVVRVTVDEAGNVVKRRSRR